jgi:O-antigen/teichoic acid export membrane protein
MDQILVSLRCDPATFAQYSVGAFEIPLIGIVTSSIASVVVVDYATLYREGRYAEIVALIHRVMIRSSLLLMPAMFFLFSVAPDLMTVVFGQQYEASSSVFRVYLLLLPMRTLTYGALLQASGRSRHILYQALSEIVIGAIVGWMAISVAGALGAAIALILVGYFTCIPYYLCVLRSALACPVRRLFPWQELLHVTALSGVGVLGVMAANYLLPMPPPVVRLAVDAMVYWCLTLAGFHLAGWTALFRPTEYLYSLLGIDRSPRPNETSSLP